MGDSREEESSRKRQVDTPKQNIKFRPKEFCISSKCLEDHRSSSETDHFDDEDIIRVPVGRHDSATDQIELMAALVDCIEEVDSLQRSL